MTIGKLFARTTAFLLAVLLCVLGCSCSERNDYPPELTATDGQGEALSYRIVIPSACSAALKNAADGLALRIAEQTGVTATAVYDTEPLSERVNETEILLGLTNRSVSMESMKSLKKDDYICRVVNGAVVLGGKTDSATVVAVERFCREILPAATAELLMSEDGGFSLYGSYPYEQVLLNGFDLYEYGIVCPNNASEELLRLASSLQGAIAEKSGYWLSVSLEADRDKTGKGIFLVTEKSEGGSVCARLIPNAQGVTLCAEDSLGISAQGVTLCAEDSLGISAAARELFSLLFAPADQGVCSAVLSSTRECSYEGGSHRLAFVRGDGWLTQATPIAVTSQLQTILSEYSPDAVLFGVAPAERMEYVQMGLYGYQTSALSLDAAHAVIVGKKQSSVELVWADRDGESGLSRSVCRVDSERDGFWILQLSGRLTKNCAVTLPPILTDTELPVLILAQVTEVGGALSFSDLAQREFGRLIEQTDETDGACARFSCYGTQNAFSVLESVTDHSISYRELEIRRRSLFLGK